MKLPYMIKFGKDKAYLTIQYYLSGFDIGYKVETEDTFRRCVQCDYQYHLPAAKQGLLKWIKKLPKDILFYQISKDKNLTPEERKRYNK